MDEMITILMQQAEIALSANGFSVWTWKPHGNVRLEAKVTLNGYEKVTELNGLNLRSGRFLATSYIRPVNLGYLTDDVQRVIDVTSGFRHDLRVAQFVQDKGWFTNYLEMVLGNSHGITAMLSLQLDKRHYDYTKISHILSSLLISKQ